MRHRRGRATCATQRAIRRRARVGRAACRTSAPAKTRPAPRSATRHRTRKTRAVARLAASGPTVVVSFATAAAEAAPPQRFRRHVCYTDGGMVSALPGLQIDALLAYRLCQRAGGVVRLSGGARGGLAAAGGGGQWDSCRGCWCRVRCAGSTSGAGGEAGRDAEGREEGQAGDASDR